MTSQIYSNYISDSKQNLPNTNNTGTITNNENGDTQLIELEIKQANNNDISFDSIDNDKLFLIIDIFLILTDDVLLY